MRRNPGGALQVLKNPLLLILIFGIVGIPLTSFAAKKDSKVRVEGSTTVLPVASRAAERFNKLRSERVNITVNAGGSGVGVVSTARGRADIGMLSREVTPEEMKRYEKSRLKVIPVARDAVACVVSSEIYEAGIRELTREQIRDIYLGKIVNWKELGGPDRPIVVVDKERHRGTRHVFMQYVFGDPKARAPAARLVTGSNNEEKAKITQSDSAIGMLSTAWMDDSVKGVALLENERRVEPNEANISQGNYPISRNLNFVTAGEPRGIVKEFIDFILSPEGQKIVEQSGYAPVHPPAVKGAKTKAPTSG